MPRGMAIAFKTRVEGGREPSFFLCPRSVILFLTARAPRHEAGQWPYLSQRSEKLLKREPLFNVPSVIVASLVVLALIHGVRTLLLSEDQDIQVLL